jgi:hypothetical protein
MALLFLFFLILSSPTAQASACGPLYRLVELEDEAGFAKRLSAEIEQVKSQGIPISADYSMFKTLFKDPEDLAAATAFVRTLEREPVFAKLSAAARKDRIEEMVYAAFSCHW